MHCELWRPVRYYVRCLITTAVVVWLAAFAPLTCSYHGFLLRPEAIRSPDATGMLMTVTPAIPPTTHIAHMANDDDLAARRRIGFTIANHHTSDGETGMFSLLILAVPEGLHLPPPAQFVTRTTASAAAPLHPWPPPEQPPRTV